MASSETPLEALRGQLARMEHGGDGAAFPLLPLALALALALPSTGTCPGRKTGALRRWGGRMRCGGLSQDHAGRCCR